MTITYFWVGPARPSFPASQGYTLAKNCVSFSFFCVDMMHTCELMGTLIVLLLLLAVNLGHR